MEIMRRNGVAVDGNDLPYTPDYTATFGGQLTRVITSAVNGFARAEVVCLVQDDDLIPREPTWLDEALARFAEHPALAILGGFMAFGSFDPDPAKAKQVWGGTEFRFVQHVNIGPYFIRREAYERLGGWDLTFSQVGEPGIGFDNELCLRAWLAGYQVGYSFVPFKGPAGHYPADGGTVVFSPHTRVENSVRNSDTIFRRYGPHADRIDELVAAAKALNTANPEKNPDFSGIYFPGADPHTHQGWLFTHDGQYAEKDGDTWKAAFNNEKGKQVLQQLKDMRWSDNSMGARQSLEWADLLQMMAGGKLGMYMAAPDNVEAIGHHFQQGGDAARATSFLQRAGRRAISLNAYATARQHLLSARQTSLAASLPEGWAAPPAPALLRSPKAMCGSSPMRARTRWSCAPRHATTRGSSRR